MSNFITLRRSVFSFGLAISGTVGYAQPLPHPCDLLDRSTVGMLIGQTVREPASGRNVDKKPDVDISGCLYFSANRNRPMLMTRLFKYAYPSPEAAQRAFSDARSRQGDPSFQVEDLPKLLGSSAIRWNAADGSGVIAVNGKKIVHLQITGSDWKNIPMLQERLVQLATRARREL